MKEIREILERVSAFGPDDRAVLATVVDVRGSGYRLPGARMLILESGDTFGMVSGGCLEADVLERAKKVLKTGRAEVFTYDTTNDENSVFSLNMGCRGVIRILLEPVGRDDHLLKILREIGINRRRQAIATLISADSEIDVQIGGRAFFKLPDTFEFEYLPPLLNDRAEFLNECRTFFSSGIHYDFQTFELPEGSFEFALESIEPPLSLLLFGAGADAVPLVRIVAELGWQVSVFDHRPAYLTTERFPSAKSLIPRGTENSAFSFESNPGTAAVIMTHNYERDTEILPLLLKSDVFYIGALGPKRRTEQLLGELAASGENFAEEQMAKLFAPAGLDIGADTPEAIALSIIAEIQSVMRNRDGGHLRDRKGSIYDRK
jgi:xanthine dehydrogenase accessory factor